MYNMDVLNKQIQVIYGRVLGLYQQPQARTTKNDVLPIALKELGVASEELQVAVEELTRQNEVLAAAQEKADTVRFLYQSLFEFAPDATIITTLSGTIQEANQAAVALLGRHVDALIGKPFVVCVALDDRTEFRTLLNSINQPDSSISTLARSQFTAQLHRRSQDCFEAQLTVDVIYNKRGEAILLRWQLQDVSKSKHTITALLQDNLAQFRYIDRYHRGELLPIEPQSLNLVIDGVVKLTTLSQRGEEILVGLATEEQVFGASLTKLSTYQAIAVTDVKLATIPASKMTESAELSRTLLPRLMQRFQQTERFLAVQGHLRTCDRFEQLLQVLKEEIGEPTTISEDSSATITGTRLKVKLTHQDFASACCTTRVTITRLLGQLQQAGKVCFDAQNHLVLKDGAF
ncbi:PAS domain-containing protein [Pseudanabaenaceae cyanobacterium LEGE 13415]|nr:PAS domain-containing protein [Pseudanabaenaceae cyanobacterium LEGE 13415]